MPRSKWSLTRTIASRVTHELTGFVPLLFTGALITGILNQHYLIAAFFAVLAVDWCEYIRPERMIGLYALLTVGLAANIEYTYAAAALICVAASFVRSAEVIEF